MGRLPSSITVFFQLSAMFVGAALACATTPMLRAQAPNAALSAADRDGIEFFEKKIRPVLVERCYECHSNKAKSLEGNFSLETKEGLLKGGDRGPAIDPGNPEKSRLVQAIRYADESFQMPPKEKGQLSKEIVADFEAWIKRGAPDPRVGGTGTYAVDIEAARGKWPFTPPIEPVIPSIQRNDWPKNDIDRFVLARLEAAGLSPGSDADKRTLIRRVTYDLVGLPPTPDEIDAFLADSSEAALATVVDRLLASPQYGERWGRHWLDVVRYADTAGDNSDYPIPQMVKYRNWVIGAFNRDLPYDQFIREQLAGDLLSAESPQQKYEQIIATGYLALARRFGSTVDDYPQHLTIEDTIDNLGKAFLGMSLNCARCHNHKFDPFTTEDYYAVYGIFHSTRYPWPGIELDKKQRDLVPLAPEEVVAAATKVRQAKLDELSAALKQKEQEKTEADKVVKEFEKQLEEARKANSEPNDETKSFAASLDEAKKRVDELSKAVQAAKKPRDELERSSLPFDQAYAVAEGKKIENVKIHIKGDPAKAGTEVPRRFPQVLGGQLLATDEQGSGRLQLARWIADPANPLTARVMVNRLWQHHFGKGIVPTPNDFGKQGKPATHPELLDCLARQFVESGWSIKALHRLIVLSRTYQMSSDDSEAAMKVDPANDLLWRHNRRRLDAESIRDSLLVLGGNLDSTMGGEHPFPPQKDWDFTQHKPFKAVYETNRRSVYLMTQRIQRHPFLAIFDGPDTAASTSGRVISTTSLQALYLLNDPFVHEQAAKFAARVRAARDDDVERIDLAYQLAFGRKPTHEEVAASREYLSKAAEKLKTAGGAEDQRLSQAWESFARVLFRANEIVYLN